MGYLGEGSPDRVDALVWALSNLMLVPEIPTAYIGTFPLRASGCLLSRSMYL